MKKVFDYTVSVAIVAGMVVGLGYAIASASAMPDVHFSYASGECVKVINYKENVVYTCENYPEKFHHVWVK
jgi:hypothetical protein